MFNVNRDIMYVYKQLAVRNNCCNGNVQRGYCW